MRKIFWTRILPPYTRFLPSLVTSKYSSQLKSILCALLYHFQNTQSHPEIHKREESANCHTNSRLCKYTVKSSLVSTLPPKKSAEDLLTKDFNTKITFICLLCHSKIIKSIQRYITETRRGDIGAPNKKKASLLQHFLKILKNL